MPVFAETYDQTLAEIEDPVRLKRFQSFVSLGFDEDGVEDDQARMALEFLRDGAFLDCLGPPLTLRQASALESLLASAAQREKLFGHETKWDGDRRTATARIERLLRKHDEDALLEYLGALPEATLRDAWEAIDILAIAKALLDRNAGAPRVKIPPAIRELSEFLAMSGERYYAFPLLRMALLQGRVIACRRTDEGFSFASPSDWIDRPLYEADGDDLRFILKRDLPSRIAGKPKPPGSRPRGRPPGTGYEDVDAPFVEQAYELVRNGRCSNGTEAARMVIGPDNEHGPPGASPERVVKRLAQRVHARIRSDESEKTKK